jgi:hypothetical protein
MTSQGPSGHFPIQFAGRTLTSRTGYWKTGEQGIDRLKKADRLLALGNTLEYVRYLSDFPVFPMVNVWDDTVTSGFADPKVYVVQTNTRVLERALLMATDPAISCSTRHAAAARRRTSPSSGAAVGLPATRAAWRWPWPAPVLWPRSILTTCWPILLKARRKRLTPSAPLYLSVDSLLCQEHQPRTR